MSKSDPLVFINCVHNIKINVRHEHDFSDAVRNLPEMHEKRDNVLTYSLTRVLKFSSSRVLTNSVKGAFEEIIRSRKEVTPTLCDYYCLYLLFSESKGNLKENQVNFINLMSCFSFDIVFQFWLLSAFILKSH